MPSATSFSYSRGGDSGGSILDGGAQGSRLLAQYDNEKNREQYQQERQQVSDERARHNQAIEQLEQQRFEVARMQTEAKFAQQRLAIQAAEKQAKDIQGATGELGKLIPESDTYNSELATIRGKYPAAFVPSKNGAEGSMLDFVKHLDSQNEEYSRSKHQIAQDAVIDARQKSTQDAIAQREKDKDSGKIPEAVQLKLAEWQGQLGDETLDSINSKIEENRNKYDSNKSSGDPANAELINEHNSLLDKKGIATSIDTLRKAYPNPSDAPQSTAAANQAISGQPAPDADKYITGKQYRDKDGNTATYQGNGKWQ